MATGRSNLPRLLRAAISHRNATTLLHHYHDTSPASFLHSHPSKIHPHLFSTFLSRRVRTRATAHPNPQNPLSISDPFNLRPSKQHLFPRRVRTRATAFHKRRSPYSIWPYALTLGCIATGGMIVYYKFREKPRMIGIGSMSDKAEELWFQGSVPHLYGEGHSVVVEGLIRPENKISNGAAKNVTLPKTLELYLSVTEVLDQPHHVATALQRRNNIILSEEEKKKIVATKWCKTPFDGLSFPAVDLSKSESEGLVFKLDSPEFVSFMTEVVKHTLAKFQDLPKLLREGHSVFIKGSIKFYSDLIMLDEIKKVRADEIKEDESNGDKWPKSVTGKSKEIEYHFSAEAIAKHD